MAWGVRNLIFTQVGELYDCFTARGATVVGFTDQDGYDHYDSKAIRDDKFCGLMCDEQNQMDQSEDRATAWVEQLKAEGMPLGDGVYARATPSPRRVVKYIIRSPLGGTNATPGATRVHRGARYIFIVNLFQQRAPS